MEGACSCHGHPQEWSLEFCIVKDNVDHRLMHTFFKGKFIHYIIVHAHMYSKCLQLVSHFTCPQTRQFYNLYHLSLNLYT